MKNDFDWSSLDNVIEGTKNMDDSDNEKSVDPECK